MDSNSITSHYPANYWMASVRSLTRVIAALVRRESRAHFGQMRLGYLWAIIEPMLHMGVYTLLFTYILKRHSPLGGNLTLFMLSGLMPYFFFSKMASYLSTAVDGNRALLNLPPVKPLDVVAARAILDASTYLFVSFILLVILGLSGAIGVIPNDAIQLSIAIVGIFVMATGIGMINAVLRLVIHNWMTFFGFLLSPIFLLSGIWFLPAEIPSPYRFYLLYNPMMHYIMWLRCSFYVNYDPPDLDRSYALWWSAASILLGLTLFRVCRRKLVEPT